jgi:PIN domain nuclease of toxin-antitoxin system
MKLLIDTHVLLDMTILATEKRLSKKAQELILHADSQILLSYASIWEMITKQGMNKLRLPSDAVSFAKFECEDKGMKLLPIKLTHLGALAGLRKEHRDPFNRLLAAQAQVEKVAILSGDESFDELGVERVW